MTDVPIRMPAKDPWAIVDYELDFTTELSSLAPVTLTSLSWSVLPIVGDSTPCQVLAHTEPLPDNSITIVSVSGGTLGNDYLVRCSRQFSDGERDVVSFQLLVDYT